MATPGTDTTRIVLIACFGDPGLAGLKEHARQPSLPPLPIPSTMSPLGHYFRTPLACALPAK
jgi:hypothetical protein